MRRMKSLLAWCGVFAAIGSVAGIGLAAGTKPSQIERTQRPSAAAQCQASRIVTGLASRTTVTSSSAAHVAHGGSIEIAWQLPEANPAAASYLIGAMPDWVRFEGNYQFDQDGNLASGPGFMALPGKARAPFAIDVAGDRTRVIVPISDAQVARTGGLRVKPYAAGPLTIDWFVVTVDPLCAPDARERISVKALKPVGPFDVASSTPQIIVQDFVTPDPLLELAQPNGTQKLTEVEISQDGLYRLEVFTRRYRVFDRATGAKLVDRSGVKPRFSPSGRFLVASVGDADQTYPTNLELIDLVAGKVAGRAGGPIIGWSNNDALMIDAGRAYQSATFVSPLIEPVYGQDGATVNWQAFFPGCGTCDAWVSSNILFDWDQLAVLRADTGEERRAMTIVKLASGRKFETSSFGDDEAAPLEQELRRVYGRPDVILPAGWTGNTSLKLTHVGRGYEGYTDEDASLQPAEAGRANQNDILAPRRLALSNGQVLSMNDLRPAGTARGDERGGALSRTRSSLTEGNVDAELAMFGLKLAATQQIAEVEIPVPETEHDPLIRTWPAALKAEVLAVNAALKEWFKDEEFPDVIVAAWRLTVANTRYLLLQHGSPAMTVNGAHDFSFDLLTLDGPGRGTVRKLGDISGLFSQFVGRDHTVARVFALTKSRLVVAVPGSGRAVVFGLDGDGPVRAFDLVEPTVLCGFHEVQLRDLIVQSNCDGQLFVFDPASKPSAILSGRVVDNELILYTAEGFYASTYEGAHFVHVTFPGLPGVHSFEQFAKVLDRADVIAAIVTGQPLAVPAPEITPPPEVATVAFRGTRANAEIAVHGHSEITGLAAIELYEDGRFVERRNVTGATADIVFRRSLPPHVVGMTAVAIDTKGFKSRQAPVAVPAANSKQAANTLHVIAVGVDAYDKLSPLDGARFDAEKLVAELKSRAAYYHTVQTTIRVDRDATPQTVMNDIQTAIAAAGPDDTVLFFFAGHGGRTDDGRYFMAVAQTDPDNLAQTAIDWQRAADLLGSTKGRVIAILDACHSGQTAVAPTSNDGAVASLAKSTQAPMVVLAASKGRQLSEESPDGSGGVFTQTLAKLLGSARASTDTNADGVLQISEVYRNLRQSVDAVTATRQTPWLVRKNIVGDAPLF